MLQFLRKLFTRPSVAVIRSNPGTLSARENEPERGPSHPGVEQTVSHYLKQLNGEELVTNEQLAEANSKYLFVLQALDGNGEELDGIRIFAFNSAADASQFGQHIVPVFTFSFGLTMLGEVRDPMT